MLEDAPIIIPVVQPEAIAETTTPASAPITDSFVDDENPVFIPLTEVLVYENIVPATELEYETVNSTIVEPEEIEVATTPVATPIMETIVEEERLDVTVGKTLIYENDGRMTVLENEGAVEKKTATIEQQFINTPVSDSVFEFVEPTPISDNTEEEITKSVIVTRTTIIEDDEVVAQITEYKSADQSAHKEATSDEPIPAKPVILVDEVKKEETKEEAAQKESEAEHTAQISTIPMTSKGTVKHEEPMIHTIPPIAAKGVGSNAADTPFVLPATEDGRRTMATYAQTPEENEPSFKSALRKAEDIPVAPMIDREGNAEPAPTPAPTTAPTPAPETPTDPEVIMADADVEILYGGDNEPEPEDIPEVIEEPEVEEPVIEEPAAEPVEESIEEPVAEPIPEEPEVEEPIIVVPVEEPEIEESVEEPEVEEPIIEEPAAEPEEEEPAPMPIVEPVFTDAEHADELMTDEEAEEHIEILEEEPGKERKGKMDAINLDTICENFEDGEEVTLEALKAKKLIPNKIGRVKILARGTMTKKLDIVADSFSLQAVKMITLAGGRAEQFK